MIIKKGKDEKGGITTVDDIEDQMEDLYCIYKDDNITSEYGRKGKVSLNAFQGKFYKWVRIGHRSNACRYRVKETCNYHGGRDMGNLKG